MSALLRAQATANQTTQTTHCAPILIRHLPPGPRGSRAGSIQSRRQIVGVAREFLDSDRCVWTGYATGVAPETAFEDLPDDRVCPVCGVDKDEFCQRSSVAA